MKLEDVLVVEFGSAFSGQIGLAGDEVYLIRVVVDVDADRIETVGERKLHDYIHADMFPGPGGDFVQLEDSTRILCRFVALAGFAAEHILFDKDAHLRPPVQARN